MFTINVRFTVEEAIALMRIIAAKQSSEGDVEKREDLEELRARLYDKIYHTPAATIPHRQERNVGDNIAELTPRAA